ncbi:uncharacterized protein AAES06_013632 isoform 2-T2 [Glossophaga mutica]
MHSAAMPFVPHQLRRCQHSCDESLLSKCSQRAPRAEWSTQEETSLPRQQTSVNTMSSCKCSSAPAVCCFTCSTLAKHFPLRTFFIHGNKKTVPQAGGFHLQLDN